MKQTKQLVMHVKNNSILDSKLWKNENMWYDQKAAQPLALVRYMKAAPEWRKMNNLTQLDNLIKKK